MCANNDLECVQSAFKLFILLRTVSLSVLSPLKQSGEIPLEGDDILLQRRVHSGLLNVLLDSVVQTLPLAQQDWNITQKIIGQIFLGYFHTHIAFRGSFSLTQKSRGGLLSSAPQRWWTGFLSRCPPTHSGRQKDLIIAQKDLIIAKRT